ncbi:MAG: hypothetical protein ACYTEW_25915 [Planctomycetota bacterium]|jgi:hypothetical protein
MGEKTRLLYVDVVVIMVALTIISTTTVPKFTKASTESKVSDLIEGLETMRVQLDLYRAQHNDSFPPSDSFESFETALTKKVGKYGPYVKKIPVNPFNRLNTVRFDGEPAGAGKAGWRLDTETGLFQADDSPVYVGL